MFTKIPFVILTVLVLSACSTTEKPGLLPGHNAAEVVTTPWPTYQAPLAHKLPADQRQALQLVLQQLGEAEMDAHSFELLYQDVEQMMTKFRGDRHKWFQNALYRGEKYFPMVRKILTNKKIPEELLWLAFIESGYEYAIKSPVGARGIWQFMPDTAREYGLEVSSYQDQRLDPYQATLAARAYLLDRVGVYGANSFLLIVASYNAGEGGVSRALRKLEDPFGQRNFSRVREFLPNETRYYVPQFLAAILLGSQPERYGFTIDNPQTTAYIQLAGKISIADYAQRLGMSEVQLRQLNPDLLNMAATPVSNFVLRFPVQALTLAQQSGQISQWWQGNTLHALPQLAQTNAVPEEPPLKLAMIDNAATESWSAATTHEQKARLATHSPGLVVAKQPSVQILPKKTAAEPNVSRHAVAALNVSPLKKSGRVAAPAKLPSAHELVYRVQAGDNLAEVSRWFGISEQQLVDWNPQIAATRRLLRDQNLRLRDMPHDWRITEHKVQSGESLWTIAGLYGVSAEALADWNNLKNDTVLQGSQLRVYYRQAQLASTKQSTKALSYTVKAGNYLAGIATLFDVSIHDLKQWNHLADGTIHPGQVLKVQLPKPLQVKHYAVKKGDTLKGIANRLQVNQNDLCFMNGMQPDRVFKTAQNILYISRG